jgi:uncharacterized repeat protein (TIGR01451 family)
MTRMGRRLLLLLFTASLGCASGCFGISQNPSYFPYWVPFGDVVETHAKPIGSGYYENFDPHAIDLSVEPAILTTQVGAQVVVLATVRDEKGEPRRNRRINWFVSGGNLIEVDESGVWNGRGATRGNSAYSYTNYHEHRLSRGNENKGDDIMLRPGQSWCVVSSPAEGDTHVQVVVPGIFNWDKRMKTALIRWVDVTWEFPAAGIEKFGTEHVFVTKVARHTDRLPLANYLVRYKILDGPPAILLPSRTTEHTTKSDASGNAPVRIAQVAPASGINRVSVEIIRPPDPTAPSGTGVPIASGITSVEWLAPSVGLSHVGPPSAPVGTNVVYQTTATNTGRMDSEWVEFTLPVPDGMEFVSSSYQSPVQPRDGQLLLPFGVLGTGQMHTVQTTFRAVRAGPVRSVALMRTREGMTDQKEVTTLITTPQLKMDLSAPKTGLIDQPAEFRITLTNPGSGELDKIVMTAEFDKGLEHDALKDFDKAKQKNFLSVEVPGLKPGESRLEKLVLTPRQMGTFNVLVTASSSGLTTQAAAQITAQKPNVSLRVDGPAPAKLFVGRSANWRIVLKNDGAVDLTGVVVRSRLPAEQQFKSASRAGSVLNGDVTWTIGAMRAGEEIALDLTTDCVKAAAASDLSTLLTADGNVQSLQTSRLEIQGIAALKMVMSDLSDPVEVGKTVVYRMVITNTGSAPANRIEVKGIAPEPLRPAKASGPSRNTINGRLIAFDKVDNLQPGNSLTYQFECDALKAGDIRFRVEYTSDLNENPIYEEESTHIVPSLQQGAPADPPPPPGGGVPKPLPPG